MFDQHQYLIKLALIIFVLDKLSKINNR